MGRVGSASKVGGGARRVAEPPRSQTLGNKTRARSRAASQVPRLGESGAGRGQQRGRAGPTAQESEGPLVPRLVPRPAARVPRSPQARTPTRADYKSQEAQRQRGAGPGAIPRDPARWEALRTTQRRRPEGGERAGGRGRGRRGPEPCVPGRGPAGQAAGGARSRRRGLHGAGGSVPARRAAHGGLGSGTPARQAAQHAARGPTPRPGARAARPLPGGRPSAPALGARRLPAL